MWYVWDVLYVVLYVRGSSFVVRGCAVSRRYIKVCNCDIFSVVNVYLDHLKFWVVCIDGRIYFCCSECNVVTNECNEPTSCLVLAIGTHGGEVVYFVCVFFRGELGFLNCDDICMCVVNKLVELLEFFFIPFMLTYSMMRFISLLLLGRCPCVMSVVMWSSLVCLWVVVVRYVDAVVALTNVCIVVCVAYVSAKRG